jgi:hypothetical protein
VVRAPAWLADLDDADETLAGVREVPGGVALTLSKEANGDLEVFMSSDVASAVAAALRDAASV